MGLAEIVTISQINGQLNVFEMTLRTGERKLFKCGTPVDSEDWVAAIRSAMRQQTIPAEEREANGFLDSQEQTARVLMVSIKQGDAQETVLARNVAFNRMLRIPPLAHNDSLVLTLSDSGMAVISQEIFKSGTNRDVFSVPVKYGPLSCALDVRVIGLVDPKTGHSNGKTEDVGADGTGSEDNDGPSNMPQISSDPSQSSKPSTSTPSMDIITYIVSFIAGSFTSVTSLANDIVNRITRDKEATIGIILSLLLLTSMAFSMIDFIVPMSFSTAESLPLSDQNPDTNDSIFASPLAGGYSYGLWGMLLIGSLQAFVTFFVALNRSASVVASLRNVQRSALIVHGIRLTRPDEDKAADSIPQRFINGCFGDLVEAKRRWEVTRRWREQERVDSLLDEEQANFTVIKKNYPHYFLCSGKDGNIVYVERPPGVDMQQLKSQGVTVDKLVRHYVYLTEYLWRVLDVRETGRTICILDVDKVRLQDVVGDVLEFIRRASALIQEHYPERCMVIMIVNTPFIFSMVWALIRPFVNEVTQKKIRILKTSETYGGLVEFMPADKIPKEYGGQLVYGDGSPDCTRFSTPLEIDFFNYTERLNQRFKSKRNLDDDDVSDAKKIGMSVTQPRPQYAGLRLAAVASHDTASDAGDKNGNMSPSRLSTMSDDTDDSSTSSQPSTASAPSRMNVTPTKGAPKSSSSTFAGLLRRRK